MSPTAMLTLETEVKEKWTKILESQVETSNEEYKLVSSNLIKKRSVIVN
jgi:hypothetical protein